MRSANKETLGALEGILMCMRSANKETVAATSLNINQYEICK
jgi:hypothetical protein